jgi:hypothetical protein
MTRKRSQKTAEKEARIQKALAGLSSGLYESEYAAAKALGVSANTLGRRRKGGKSLAEAHESSQLLSAAEEKALTRWITRLTYSGYPATHAFIREMAEEIRQRRIRAINSDGMNLVFYPPIGTSWVPTFLKRYPKLQTTLTRSIEASRVKVLTKEAILDWFNAFQEVMEEEQITIENVYNVDESGKSRLNLTDCRLSNWNSTTIICSN